jgi:hypothetical protein
MLVSNLGAGSGSDFRYGRNVVVWRYGVEQGEKKIQGEDEAEPKPQSFQGSIGELQQQVANYPKPSPCRSPIAGTNRGLGVRGRELDATSGSNCGLTIN